MFRQCRYVLECYGRRTHQFTYNVCYVNLFHLYRYEQDCLPPVICGTSIGALLAGMLGVCKDDELPSIWSPGGRVMFEDFSESNLAAVRKSQRPPWARKLTRLLKVGVEPIARVSGRVMG